MSSEEVKVGASAAEAADAAAGGAAEDGAVEDGAAEGGTAPAAATARPKPRRLRDMAMSMAVLLVPIAVFYVGWQWVASDRQVSVVDTSENHATAASLGLAAIEPELTDEWKAISTDLAVEGETVVLRTGYYSPEGHGLQLVETNGTAADVNEELTGAGTPVEAAGIEWAAYESATSETWVAEIGGETVAISAETDGAGDLAELAEGVADAA
ncbi:DUF4245 family protein [Glycomyces sp. NPDC048151]|uniref:DUF4245 family protein n=1 Tax=Glycomyces sp. NPDC048151 TaxID=3364002 RepID=UPI00371A1223